MRNARLMYQRANPWPFQKVTNPREHGACVSRTYSIVGLKKFLEAVVDCEEVPESKSLVSYYRDGTLIGQLIWWPDDVEPRTEHRLFRAAG
jgi:hypothetical protein